MFWIFISSFFEILPGLIVLLDDVDDFYEMQEVVLAIHTVWESAKIAVVVYLNDIAVVLYVLPINLHIEVT